jgi:hypothetical protein
MSRPLKTAAELVALLNAELRKQEACTWVSGNGITPVANERVAYTWTATASGVPVVLCQDNARACSRGGAPPSTQYDLAPEE